MFQYTTWGRKIFFNFQILFLTPFCNQKRYFRVFHSFMHKSLPNNLKYFFLVINSRKKKNKINTFQKVYKILTKNEKIKKDTKKVKNKIEILETNENFHHLY